MQSKDAAYDFSRLYYLAGPNRQRVLLTAMANRHLPSLPALPEICGVETREELEQVIADLGATCTRLGYTLDDFVILKSDRLYPGHLTEQASPAS